MCFNACSLPHNPRCSICWSLPSPTCSLCFTCSSVHSSTLRPSLAHHHLCYVDVYSVFDSTFVLYFGNIDFTSLLCFWASLCIRAFHFSTFVLSMCDHTCTQFLYHKLLPEKKTYNELSQRLQYCTWCSSSNHSRWWLWIIIHLLPGNKSVWNMEIKSPILWEQRNEISHC